MRHSLQFKYALRRVIARIHCKYIGFYINSRGNICGLVNRNLGIDVANVVAVQIDIIQIM